MPLPLRESGINDSKDSLLQSVDTDGESRKLTILPIITDRTSSDKDLQSNVQNSSTSAYEAAVAERLSSRIMDGLFDGTVNGDTEKAEFYTELSENTSALIQIRNSIIRKIKDLLLAS